MDKAMRNARVSLVTVELLQEMGTPQRNARAAIWRFGSARREISGAIGDQHAPESFVILEHLDALERGRRVCQFDRGIALAVGNLNREHAAGFQNLARPCYQGTYHIQPIRPP